MILVLPWLIGASGAAAIFWGVKKLADIWEKEDREQNTKAEEIWGSIESLAESLISQWEDSVLEWNKSSEIILGQNKKSLNSIEKDIENIKMFINTSNSMLSMFNEMWDKIQQKLMIIKEKYDDTDIGQELNEENSKKIDKLKSWQKLPDLIESHIWDLNSALQKKEEQKRLVFVGMDSIDKMDGLEFEKFLLVHFMRMGYQGSLTQQSQDFGADLILMKNGQKYVIQAKRSASAVSVKAIQEIIGAKGYYNADVAIVVTNSNYTENAKELAYRNKVELWDREKLIQFIFESKQV